MENSIVKISADIGFNPCFNGFMDKDAPYFAWSFVLVSCFNPCFNGFMDKDWHLFQMVSTSSMRFNPCFNGFMDKDSD